MLEFVVGHATYRLDCDKSVCDWYYFISRFVCLCAIAWFVDVFHTMTKNLKVEKYVDRVCCAGFHLQVLSSDTSKLITGGYYYVPQSTTEIQKYSLVRVGCRGSFIDNQAKKTCMFGTNTVRQGS